jgi:hypothetical protein
MKPLSREKFIDIIKSDERPIQAEQAAKVHQVPVSNIVKSFSKNMNIMNTFSSRK